MWSEKFRNEVEEIVKVSEGNDFKIKYFESIRGGDISSAFRLAGTTSNYFIKINEARRYPDMFEKEALGLRLLHSAQAVKTPQVIAFGESDGSTFLILEWIDLEQFTISAMHDLGIRLAKMHLYRHEDFGFYTSNYMGSLHQDNTPDKDWLNFFIQRRLNPQIKLALSSALLQTSDVSNFEKVYTFLNTIYEPEKPSLVHGDLWNGNAVTDKLQEPILIDPAAYYAHREIDIAMTRLFGGFGDGFYNAYQETFPLKRGWQERCDIWNLYPLLIHLNLFGGSYLHQIRAVFKRYL